MLQNPESQNEMGSGLVHIYSHAETLWGPFWLCFPCLCQCFSSDFLQPLSGALLTQNPAVSRNSHVESLRTGLKCHLCQKLCGKAAAHQGQGWGMSKCLQTSASLLREIISVFLHSDHTSYSDAQEQHTFLSSWFMWPLRFIPSDRSLKFFLFIFFSRIYWELVFLLRVMDC